MGAVALTGDRNRIIQRLLHSAPYVAGERVVVEIPRDAVYQKLVVEIDVEIAIGAVAPLVERLAGLFNLFQKTSVVVNNKLKPVDEISPIHLMVLNHVSDGKPQLGHTDLPVAVNATKTVNLVFDIPMQPILPNAENWGLDLRQFDDRPEEIRKAELIMVMGVVSDLFETVNDASVTSGAGVKVWAHSYKNKSIFPENLRLPLIYRREKNATFTDEEYITCPLLRRNNIAYLDMALVVQDEEGTGGFANNKPVSMTHGEEIYFEQLSVNSMRQEADKNFVEPMPDEVLHIPLSSNYSAARAIIGADLREDVKLKIAPAYDAAKGVHRFYCMETQSRAWNFGEA